MTSFVCEQMEMEGLDCYAKSQLAPDGLNLSYKLSRSEIQGTDKLIENEKTVHKHRSYI